MFPFSPGNHALALSSSTKVGVQVNYLDMEDGSVVMFSAHVQVDDLNMEDGRLQMAKLCAPVHHNQKHLMIMMVN